MKFIKLSLAAAMAVTFAYAEETSDLGVSANVTATSNYVWRGMSQTGNSPAIQGGFDLDYKGVYVGVWGSNINFGGNASLEADIYAGYAMDIKDFSFDVGYCQFTYPNESDALNFGEAYVKLGYDFKVVSIGGAYYLGVDTNDVENDDVNGWEPENAWEVSASVPLPMDISIDAMYGDYDTLGDYYLVGLNKSFDKFDFTLAYTANDADGDSDAEQDNIVFSVGSSF